MSNRKAGSSRTKPRALSKNKKRVAGGAATGGGINFQAAVTAITCVYMARGRPLSWLDKLVSDIPIAVSAETGGPGDDLRLRLKTGEAVEIQIKKGLRVGPHLWSTLLKLATAISKSEIDFGVLVVSSTSSATISEELCRDIVRLGDGRRDNLSSTAEEFARRLQSVNLPVHDVCRRLRIQTISAVQGNTAHVAAAQSELAHLCHVSSQVVPAWNALTADASALIEQRGRRNTSSVLQLLSASGVTLSDSHSNAPALLLRRLCRWTFDTHRYFSVFGVQERLETDEAWIALEAVVREEDGNVPRDLAEALEIYHSWERRYASKSGTGVNSETFARFVTRAVLVGGPGMGKTTLLKRLARRYSEDSVPVLHVKLSAVAARIRSGSTFEEAVLALGLDGSGISPQEARNAAYPNWFLLCDGLDECGALQEQVAEGIDRFVEGHPECRLLVTTRPIGYDTSRFRHWRHYSLKPLGSSDAIGHLTSLVIKCASANSPLRDYEAAHDVCKEELEPEEVCDVVSRTPLMLALAASIIVRGGSLGCSREQLFGQILALIDSIPNTRSPAPPATAPILNYFLDVAGWEIVTNPISSVGETLDRCAQVFSRETNRSLLSARSDSETFFRYWQDVGLIERVGFGAQETLAFIHKTFGEFAAARHLRALPLDAQKAAISSIIDVPACNEVLRFAGLSGLADVVCELLIEHGADERATANRTLLAVELVALSSPPPAQPIRKSIFDVAIDRIASERCDLAFEVVHALPAAARRFPGEVAPALAALLTSKQDWTHLIAWAALSATGSDHFGREDLSEAFVSIARKAGPSFRASLGGGISVRLGKDPEREITEAFLLAAASILLDEAANDALDALVRDALSNEGLHTLGFVEKVNAIVKSKGKDWRFGRFDTSRWAALLSGTEGYERAQLMTYGAILDAFGIAEDSEVEIGDAIELLYFSAFLDVSSFWEMPAYDAWAWTREYDRDATREVLRGVVGVSGIDIEKLKSDLVKARAFLNRSGSNAFLKITTHVDPAPPNWTAASGLGLDIGKIESALYHSSEWIVMLAANLLMHMISPTELLPVVRRAFDGGRDHTLWAASFLAKKPDSTQVRDVTTDRLSGQLVPGCEYLFKLLGQLGWQLEEESHAVLQNGLRSQVDIAVEAARRATDLAEPGDDRLASIVTDAFEYWKKAEEPYPIGGGVVPRSPRADLLRTLTKLKSPSYEELRSHVADSRPDVRDVAIGEIVTRLTDSSKLRMQLLKDVSHEALPSNVLSKAILSMVPLTNAEWDEVKSLLVHANPKIRYAAMTALEKGGVDHEVIETLAKTLTDDEEREIVDRAYRILDGLSQRTPPAT